jgi:alpha-tubulin suppressor-like RCC1 family protein
MKRPLRITVIAGILLLPGATAPAAAIPDKIISGPTSSSVFRHTNSQSGGPQWSSFGRNHYGQLLLGEPVDTALVDPNKVALPAGAGSINVVASGPSHTLYLDPGAGIDAGVFSTGCNRYGELGRSENAGTYVPSPVPRKVPIPGNLVPGQIFAGESFSLLVGPGSFVFSFGSNQYGQLGNPQNAGTAVVNSAALIVTVPESVAVWDVGNNNAAVGAHHCLVIATHIDGTKALYAWGSNLYGQLGVPTNAGTTAANSTPARVPLPSSPVRVYAGAHFSLVVCADKKMYAFGRNLHGQLGTSTNAGTDFPNPTPQEVTTTVDMNMWSRPIAAGGEHVLAVGGVGASERLYAWGSNRYGQLGRSSNSGTDAPNPEVQAVADLPAGSNNGSPTIVVAGADHSIACWGVDPSSGGYQKAWGLNLYGQLGNTKNWGTSTPNPKPLDISTTVTGIDAPATVPLEFVLRQNYPNPFNPSTTIEFAVPEAGPARLAVYDMLGHEVAAPFDGRAAAGQAYRVTLDGAQLPSGMYVYRLTTGGAQATRKMVLLK